MVVVHHSVSAPQRKLARATSTGEQSVGRASRRDQSATTHSLFGAGGRKERVQSLAAEVIASGVTHKKLILGLEDPAMDTMSYPVVSSQEEQQSKARWEQTDSNRRPL